MFKKKKIKFRPAFYILVLVILLIIVLIFIPKNHFKKYKVNNYQIEEKFNKKNKRYNISFSKDDKKYDFNFDSKYIGKKIVTSINELKNENEECITFNIDKINTIPLCIKDNKNVDFNLIEKIDLKDYKTEKKGNNKSYDNIKIYNLIGKTYFLWNYNKFYYINDDENSEIKLFDSDYYIINLAVKYKDYLIIPNYDNLYNFNELFIINSKTKNKEVWKLKFDISYDSYFLGEVDDYLYLVDKKNKYEYRLSVKDKEIKVIGNEENGGVIYINDKFEDISMYKLVNNVLSFEYNSDVDFFVDDNSNIYMNTNNTNTLISNKTVTKIVYQNNNYVYYLIGDDLYYYDIFNGEIRVLQNFEWNFNNNNNIFIY